jgi:hypothetical protein
MLEQEESGRRAMPEDGLLNHSQRVSLEITLRLFEESLRQGLAYLDGNETDGIWYKRRLDLPAEKQSQARKIVVEALDEIGRLAREFRLVKIEENSAGDVRAQMSQSWANLEDVKSKKLKGYGVVDARLGKALDPHIDRLAHLALALAALFENQTGP